MRAFLPPGPLNRRVAQLKALALWIRNLLPQFKFHRAILVNAGSLVGSTLVTSGVGFVYWWIATWRFPAEAIGLGSAAILAMTLLGTFCLFGLGTLLVGELPRQPGQEFSLISTAMLITGLLGACSGIIFALLAPALSANFSDLSASIINVVLFALGVGLTASSLMLDQAMIGLLRGNLQLWRNIVFAVVKLIAIYLVGYLSLEKTAMVIYTTWTSGNAISLLLLAAYQFVRRGTLRKVCRLQWAWLRKLGWEALKHHLLNITLQMPALALPVVVTMMLSAAANARFYIMWIIVSIICVVPLSLTTALYASVSAQPAQLARKMRLTLKLALAAGVLANVVLFVGAGQILRIFGHAYTEEAVAGLHILGFGVFPATIMNHFVTLCRLQRRMLTMAFPLLLCCLFELGAAALGARFGGLLGLSLWWLVARCIETGLMLPAVCRAAWPCECPVEQSATLPHAPHEVLPAIPRSNAHASGR